MQNLALSNEEFRFGKISQRRRRGEERGEGGDGVICYLATIYIFLLDPCDKIEILPRKTIHESEASRFCLQLLTGFTKEQNNVLR